MRFNFAQLNKILKELIENQNLFLSVAQAQKLYLNEKFLRVVKSVNLNADSKSIVDRATKKPVNQVLDALQNLNEQNLDEIKNFIQVFLHEPGFEITKAHLNDWIEEPEFLTKIKTPELKNSAKN